jgi:PAS domain S-box-containing protein
MHDKDLYRRFVDSTHDCVYVLDLEGRLIHANSAGLRQLGIEDSAAVPAHPFAALVDESAQGAAEQAIALALRGGCGHV